MVEVPGSFLFLFHFKNFSSRLVSNYPVFFSSDFPLTFFKQMQHNEIYFSQILEFKINHEKLYEDSYRRLHSKSPSDWKNRIEIKYEQYEYDDEDCGFTKDWFTKITEIIFNPNSEIFEVPDKNHNYSPSISHAAKSTEGLEKLKFAGMIVARALLQGMIIPVNFTLHFLKQILHHESSITPEDIEDVDPVLFDSLNYYKENDLDSMKDLDLRFEVDYENETVELIKTEAKLK